MLVQKKTSISVFRYRDQLSLCTCTRSFACANDAKIVRSRDAQCNTDGRNHLKS